ncbi:hypothetical protein HFO93_04495 [Rhizobium leguminosarum]|nr:hypothetical protein [Rhizobium leguminosarum]
MSVTQKLGICRGPPTKGWTMTLLQIAYILIAVSYVVAVIALAGGH